MKKRPVVFSLVREQSIFMTTIMAVLTFLATVALGIALAIGTGAIRWNNQWDLYATVQVSDSTKINSVEKILNENKSKLESVRKISESEMIELMKSWVDDESALKNYLPTMWEIKFKTDSDLESIQQQIDKNGQFLTHASALKNPISTGWRLVAVCGLMLIIMISAIGTCILYIAQNTAMLHRRELEILNQIGANDSFVSRQMQIIVGKISTVAASIGFVCALPILWLILSVARASRTGLMAMIALNGFDWTLLILLPIAIVIFAIMVTKKTTIHILENQ